MAWGQYEIYKDIVISKNNDTTPLYEGDLKVPILDSRVETLAVNILNGTDNLGSIGSYTKSPSSSSDTWDYYQFMISRCSQYVLGTWLDTVLTNVDDKIYYYNKNFGKSFSYVLKCISISGSVKALHVGYIYNGTEVIDSTNNLYFAGVDSQGRTRGFVWGVMLDSVNHWAAPWAGVSTYHTPAQNYDVCNISFRPLFSRSTFNTVKYGMFALFSGYWVNSDPINPYAPGGFSGPGGGDPNEQNFDEESDDIQVPALPIYSATGSGMVTAYVPTIGEINALATYLIDPSVDQAVGRVLVDMSELIISLAVFPFVVPATGHKNIVINLCGVHLASGVDSHYADGQFVQLNLGTVEIKKRWDNCLDYDPYTKISIFLPFCGFFDLDTDEVMGKTLTLIYNVDIFSGSCVAIIKVDNCVMYQFAGNCASQIPISSVSFDSMIGSAIQIGISAATAGGALIGAGAEVQAAQEAYDAAQGAENIFSTGEDLINAQDNFSAIKTAGGEKLLGASASGVLNAKGRYSHAGAMSAAPGFLGVRTPYIIKKVPKQSIPEGYSKFYGYPSNMKATLSDLSGFTVVGEIQLNIPDATVEEIVECERFLKGGVVL